MFSSTVSEDLSGGGITTHFSEYPLSSLRILSPLRTNKHRGHKQQGHVSLTQASRPSTTSDSGAFTSGSEYLQIYIE